MKWDEERARLAVIDACLAMQSAGLNVGKSGNASCRWQDGMLITPTGMAYEALTPEDIVFLPLNPMAAVPKGQRKPSSEWHFHRDILAARPEFQAVLHAHSPKATALAVQGRGIPPFHYMIAIAGGRDLRCAPYALFGTEELSRHVLDAMTDRKACIMAHHGQVAAGTSLQDAFAVMQEVEHLSGIYLDALALGEPPLLDEADMDAVIDKFKGYGKQS